MQTNDNELSIDRQALAEMVIRRLKAHDSPDDILFEICNRTAWDWRDAKQFLDDVSVERGVELASWEMRLFIILGGAFILVGLSLVGMALMYVFGEDSLLGAIRDLNMLVGFTDIQMLVFSVFTGLAMIAGGAIGIIRATRRMSSGG